MSLLLSFFVPLIKIVSLSALNEMFLAVFFYLKLPCETGIGRNVVLARGVVLGLEPVHALGSEAGSERCLCCRGLSLCWLLLCLLIHFIDWNGSRNRGRKSSASHRSAGFLSFYFNKIKLLRNEGEKWYFIKEREENKNNAGELNKHNTYQENRRMGISTHPVENHFQNSCRYFEVKYLSDS